MLQQHLISSKFLTSNETVFTIEIDFLSIKYYLNFFPFKNEKR